MNIKNYINIIQKLLILKKYMFQIIKYQYLEVLDMIIIIIYILDIHHKKYSLLILKHLKKNINLILDFLKLHKI
jgi:hypothetical protein